MIKATVLLNTKSYDHINETGSALNNFFNCFHLKNILKFTMEKVFVAVLNKIFFAYFHAHVNQRYVKEM